MKSLFLAAALGALGLIGLAPAKADASWLSQALHRQFDPAYYGGYYGAPVYNYDDNAYYPPAYDYGPYASPAYSYDYYYPSYSYYSPAPTVYFSVPFGGYYRNGYYWGGPRYYGHWHGYRGGWHGGYHHH
jgi:hypothetical protein